MFIITVYMHTNGTMLTPYCHSLAHSEARLIVCQLLYNFDIWLCPESVDWIEKQKVYFLWDKPGLMVNLRERVTHGT